MAEELMEIRLFTVLQLTPNTVQETFPQNLKPENIRKPCPHILRPRKPKFLKPFLAMRNWIELEHISANV